MITPSYSLSLFTFLPLFYPAFPYRHLVSIPPPGPGHAPVHFRLFLWSSRLLQDEEEEGRSSQREGDSGMSRTRVPPLSAPSGSEAAHCCGAQSVYLPSLVNWYLTNLRTSASLSLLMSTPVSYQSSVLMEKPPQLHTDFPRTHHLPSGDWTASPESRSEALGLFSG